MPSNKESRYETDIDCTYWPVPGSYKNYNTIHLSKKPTTFNTFDEKHQGFLERISDNMASLVQSGNYGDITTSETTPNGLYVIQFISEAYTLQKNKTN